jgi:hypothetical protein
MNSWIRVGAISALITLLFSVPIIAFDYANAGSVFPDFWIRFFAIFVPYVLFNFTFAGFAYGLAAVGAKYGVNTLTVSGAVLAFLLAGNMILRLLALLVPVLSLLEPTTIMLMAFSVFAVSVAILKLYSTFGSLIIWISISGIVLGVALLANLDDFPAVIFVGLGAALLLQALD